ncbi:MAG: hypothetical protein M4579_001548 [Chaenotheca gracillima]|nr:MAG: hypothetical protein M4579_001548 [Chaenotheca gracillima]
MANLAEANRDHFNKTASEYANHPLAAIMNPKITDGLRQHIDWLNFTKTEPATQDKHGNDRHGRQIRVLDYACGLGLVSHALAPYTDSLRGVDVSSGMVDAYNADAITELDGRKIQMSAVAGNMFQETSPTPPSTDLDYAADTFDLAVISMALHHVEDPALGVKRLAERVKPGSGVVCVLDLLAAGSAPKPVGEDEADAAAKTSQPLEDAVRNMDNADDVFKVVQSLHGFSEQDMRAHFEAAGCGEDFKFVVLPGEVVFSGLGGSSHNGHGHGHHHGNDETGHDKGHHLPGSFYVFMCRGTRKAAL